MSLRGAPHPSWRGGSQAPCHCEERSDEAIPLRSLPLMRGGRLLSGCPLTGARSGATPTAEDLSACLSRAAHPSPAPARERCPVDGSPLNRARGRGVFNGWRPAIDDSCDATLATGRAYPKREKNLLIGGKIERDITRPAMGAVHHWQSLLQSIFRRPDVKLLHPCDSPPCHCVARPGGRGSPRACHCEERQRRSNPPRITTPPSPSPALF